MSREEPWHDRSMRAMSLDHPTPIGDEPLAWVERPDPVPASDELLLQVHACAVCRTDLQICEGDVRVPQLPITPGHQVVGTVVAHG